MLAAFDTTYSQIYTSCNVDAGTAQVLQEMNNPQVFSSQSLNPSRRILTIHMHVVGDEQYNYFPDTAGLMLGLTQLNLEFERSGITFRYCAMDTIQNYKYNVFNLATEIPEIKTLYYKAGVINVFLVGSIENSTYPGYIEGHTFFPGGDDIIVIRKDEFTAGNLSHQMGHFLGLYHTYETAFGIELIDGTNCTINGDLICDTPADVPTLVDGNCIPLISIVDTAGNKYHHPVENIMSSFKNCRCHFTIGQLNKMVNTLHHNRNYLK